MPLRDLLLTTLGPLGDGVGEGREPIFVDRGLPGERVRVNVARDRTGVLRGEIVETLRRSPYRQEAPCAFYSHCGNCTLQHLQEQAYRQWKLATVRQSLQREGLQPKQWLPPCFLGGYNRRRITLTLKRARKDCVVGYYRRRSQQVHAIDSCLVAEPDLLALRPRLQEVLGPWLPKTYPLDVFLQKAEGGIELVLRGPLEGRPNRWKEERVFEQLLSRTGVVRIGWQPKVKERILLLASQGTLYGEFGPLRVELPPGCFLQPTQQGEKALQEAVLRALPPHGTFADLFSGCGTFSGPMVARGAVDCYEADAAAVRALGKAAGSYPLQVYRRDLFRHPLGREALNRYDAVVWDPPRAGSWAQVHQMATSRVPLLVGVSCNPATFARDARVLWEGGYQLRSLQVIDQFIWSHHIELVGVFERVKAPKRGRR